MQLTPSHTSQSTQDSNSCLNQMTNNYISETYDGMPANNPKKKKATKKAVQIKILNAKNL